MNKRLDINHQFIEEGIKPSEIVPPLIFHTLIENALTHSFEANESGYFKLSFKENEEEKIYSLENDGSKISKMKRLANNEEGLGLSYLRLRLSEMFADKYKITYGQTNDKTWLVTIEISK